MFLSVPRPQQWSRQPDQPGVEEGKLGGVDVGPGEPGVHGVEPHLPRLTCLQLPGHQYVGQLRSETVDTFLKISKVCLSVFSVLIFLLETLYLAPHHIPMLEMMGIIPPGIDCVWPVLFLTVEIFQGGGVKVGVTADGDHGAIGRQEG